MARVALIVWNEEECEENAAALRTLGHEVLGHFAASSSMMKHLRAFEPEVMVIDLGRLPSHGIQVGLAIRKIPIVFIEGEEEKTAKARAKVPAATYTSWKKLAGVLRRTGSLTPSQSSGSPMDLYKETPVAVKLGLDKVGKIVAVDAPRAFFALIPDGVEVVEEGENADAVFCFATSARELGDRVEWLAARAPAWIAWPKKTGKAGGDLNMYSVREIAFSAGLVDYKICGIDKQWSAMLFTRRKTK